MIVGHSYGVAFAGPATSQARFLSMGFPALISCSLVQEEWETPFGTTGTRAQTLALLRGDVKCVDGRVDAGGRCEGSALAKRFPEQ